MTVSTAVKRYQGRLVSLREFLRLRALEQQLQEEKGKRMPADPPEPYDFSW